MVNCKLPPEPSDARESMAKLCKRCAKLVVMDAISTPIITMYFFIFFFLLI